MSELPEGFNPEDWRVDQEGNLQPKEERVTRNWRRQLEEDAKRGKEAQAEVERLQRQIALRDAGITPDNPTHALFLKAYDGPPDPEAIRAEGAKYGLFQPAPGDQAQIDQSLAGHQAAMQTASGAQTQSGVVDHMSALREIAAKHRGPTAGEDARRELAQYAHEHGLSPLDLPGLSPSR